MLSENIKNTYLEDCSIQDSNKKMTDLTRMFEVFKASMESNIKEYRSRRYIYYYTKAEYYPVYITIVWFFGFILNV